ncbi:MAG: RluA family pseudouridine synthase [Clostridia bacterium]|nr:RluA family pseudouridine synthase [Clostridia bacterium]
MQKEMNFKIDSENITKRLDKFLCLQLDTITRSFIQKMIKDGYITVNEKTVSKNYKLALNDEIKVVIKEPEELSAEPENIELDIIYEDKDLLVVNKPKGMVVHPAPGHPNKTLVNALLYHCKDDLSGINGVLRPGIVHRIDKDTSGLLMVAKNDVAHQGLAKQIKDHSFNREYEAIVYGDLKDNSGYVDVPIGRHPIKRKQMAAFAPHSRDAKTEYGVLRRYEQFNHLRLRLFTGRTHQIRVHMAYIGHPVAGDEVYGPKKAIKCLNGQCLHAKKLGFLHPVTGKYMEFTSNLPEYFIEFEKTLK